MFFDRRLAQLGMARPPCHYRRAAGASGNPELDRRSTSHFNIAILALRFGIGVRMSRNFLGVTAIAAGFVLAAQVVSKAQGITQRSLEDQVSSVSVGDRAMKAAFAKARATLPSFLRLFDKPSNGLERFSVKIAVRDGGNVEYFWIYPFERYESYFSGRLNNRPRSVANVKFGQEVKFTQAEIVDWTYTDTGTGRMHGNFTACALLTQETPAERKRFLETFNIRC